MENERPRDPGQHGSVSHDSPVDGRAIPMGRPDSDAASHGAQIGQHIRQDQMNSNPYNLPPVNTYVGQNHQQYSHPYGHASQPSNGHPVDYSYAYRPNIANHTGYQSIQNPYSQPFAQQVQPIQEINVQPQQEHKYSFNNPPQYPEHNSQYTPDSATNTNTHPNSSHNQQYVQPRENGGISGEYRPSGGTTSAVSVPDRTNLLQGNESKSPKSTTAAPQRPIDHPMPTSNQATADPQAGSTNGHNAQAGTTDSSNPHWNIDHTLNDKNAYCYCGDDRNLLDVDVQCEKCLNFFHGRCIRLDLGPVVPFMTNYRFVCKNCNVTAIETFSRTATSWKNVCASALANLILMRIRTEHFEWDKSKYAAKNSAQLAQNLGWYSRKSDIVPFLEVPRHWASVCTDKDKVEATTWPSTLGNALVANPDVFRSSDESTRSANSSYTLCNLNLFSFKAGHLAGTKSQAPRKRKAEELETGTANSKTNGGTAKASDFVPEHSKLSKDDMAFIPPERTSARERVTAKNDDVPAFTAKIPTIKKEPSRPTAVATKELARERKPTAKKAAVVKKNESAPLKLIRRPPPYKPQDFGAIPKPPGMTQVEGHFADGPYYSITDIPYNKRGFKYTLCEAAPSMPATMYREVEVAPYEARIDWSDMSPYMYLTRDGKCATTDKGFRMGRANVGVREGQWYWEVKVLRGNGDHGGHVRLGVARREASLDGPLGFDAYSYGIRDKGGEKMHLSRPRPFMDSFGTGDVIGFHLSLPKGPRSELVRDRIPIRYRQQLYFEQYEYTASKEMEDLLHPGGSTTKASNPASLQGSSLKVYKNGKLMGTAFDNLFSFWPPHCQTQRDQPAQDDSQLGYYPAISVYSGGAVQLNFGPEFVSPPEGGLLSSGVVRPIAHRYDEHIAEDMVQDLIDEIDFEQDLKELSLGGEQEVEVEPIREIAEYD